MSGREVGLLLRLLGPLLQIICLILLLRPSGPGTPRRDVLTVLFLLGLVFVLAGIALSRPRRQRPPKPTDEDRPCL